MKTPRITVVAIAMASMMVAALSLGVMAGERREAPMHVLTPGGPGAEIPGTSVTVNATSNNASIKVKTRDLTSGNAITIWSFSFSTPGACVDGCGTDDAMDRPGDVGFAVNQVAGHIVGNGDRANFGGSIKVDNASGAEYHIVVADHGPLDPSQLPEQIKSGHPNQIQIGIVD